MTPFWSHGSLMSFKVGNSVKRLRFLPVVCVLFLSASVATAVASPLSIVLPPDKSFLDGGTVSVIVKGGEDGINEVRITVNGRKQVASTKKLDPHYTCYDGLHLSFGVNNIKVIGLKDGRKVEETAAQVFHRSDLSAVSSNPPPGFTRYLFHIDQNEKGCIPCHDLNFAKSDGPPQSPDKSPCYTCHKKIMTDFKFVHGPSAVWSCLDCHDGKSRERKLGVVKPDDRSCSNCHEKGWESKKFQHGPTAAGNCSTCHNPHAADRPFFLRMDAGDLCASCHEEILFRPHVISSPFSNGGHPVRLSSDPFHPTREFSCISCHNPHGSDSSVFLNGFEESAPLQNFCRSCHQM